MTPLTLTGVDTSTLSIDANNEPYEGVLLELNNVTRGPVNLPGGNAARVVSEEGTTIIYRDRVVAYTVKVEEDER